VIDPSNGVPFAGGIIPSNRISPQARLLAGFYPLPNFVSSQYNYQVPLIGGSIPTPYRAASIKDSRKNQISGTPA